MIYMARQSKYEVCKYHATFQVASFSHTNKCVVLAEA